MMVLGLVLWLQPVHGYDVRKELMSWGAEDWANVQPGSVYHALRKLADEGLLDEVATEQVGARPARTTYRVTEAGTREFQRLLREYWWGYKEAVDPFLAAFGFLPALSRPEGAAALRNRARLLRERVRELAGVIDAQPGDPEWAPVHVAWLKELWADRAEAEIAWCERVARRIEAGEGYHDAEVDTEEMGRRWREAIQADPVTTDPGTGTKRSDRGGNTGR